MPKLIFDPHPLKVTDSSGRVWEYQSNEVKTEDFEHFDYQGPPIKMVREYIELPDGSRATIRERAKNSW